MAAPEMTLENLEIIHPRTYVENGYPHEAFRILRNEAPVYWYTNTEAQPFWAITKHADIMHIGKNPQIFANAPELIVPFEPRKDGDFNPPPTLIQMDNPDHSEFRKIISRRFTPRALKKIMHDIDRIASKIIDSLLEEGDEGECDFVEKVSAPLPIAVIAWLLGVPEEDWTLLFDWTNRTIGAGDPEYQKEGEDSNATAQAAMAELFTYFAALVEERRKNPTDDLITLFTQAEVYGRKLDPMEVITYCFIIVVAGNETTRNGTTGGMLAFIEHQDQMRKLQQDPSLLKSSVEEIVRWTSPIIQFARTAMEDTEVRGVPIKKGELVGLFYPSANRDEEVFDRPYEFDITRRPNRHLGFGTGEHFCVGAHVARLEMEMAYRTLIPRIAEIELAGPPERLYSNLVGGVKHLPIRYKLHPA
jgi:cytochrome P450